MKFNTKKIFIPIGISVWMCTTEAANIIPKSYIVEYSQEDHHDIISNDLSQYKDLYDVHHTFSSPIFHGMSFSLKDSSEVQSKQHQPFAPVSYSAISNNTESHPVYEHLQNHPAIKRIYPIHEVPRPQWVSTTNGNNNFTLPFSNRDAQTYDIHEKLGITGEDILIGILDSGVYTFFV